MTFQEFQATGRAVSNLGAALDDDDETLVGVAGFVYDGDLYIERTGGGYTLSIYGDLIRGSVLAELEFELYRYAAETGALVASE